MAISKLILNGVTQMDVTDTTAEAADVANTKYFYTNAGIKTLGTASGGGGSVDLKGIVDGTVTSVDIPSGTNSIRDYAFYDCQSLTSVTIPEGITSIGTYAFYQCHALQIATLPSTLTALKGYAFNRCESIVNITCNGAITSLGTYQFNCMSSAQSTLKTARFPYMEVTSIGQVFGSTTAGNACRVLELLDLGNTKAIGTSALANCNMLTTLILRRSDAICTMTSTTSYSNTPLNGYSGRTCTVYVPNDLISTYQQTSQWSTLYNNGTVTFVKIEGSIYEL